MPQSFITFSALVTATSVTKEFPYICCNWAWFLFLVVIASTILSAAVIAQYCSYERPHAHLLLTLFLCECLTETHKQEDTRMSVTKNLLFLQCTGMHAQWLMFLFFFFSLSWYCLWPRPWLLSWSCFLHHVSMFFRVFRCVSFPFPKFSFFFSECCFKINHSSWK